MYSYNLPLKILDNLLHNYKKCDTIQQNTSLSSRHNWYNMPKTCCNLVVHREYYSRASSAVT